MAETIEIAAPSRLHFGLFALADPPRESFGGVGVMIDRPGVCVRVARAERQSVSGHHSAKVSRILESIAKSWFAGSLPPVEVSVVGAPALHGGLGVGTQMGMAIASGVAEVLGLGPRSAADLASASGRGARSAVGAHGFLRGGMIVDGGKRGPELAPLIARVEVPPAWRFVLLTEPGPPGFSGEAEATAFATLPQVSTERSALLRRIALEEMLPAVREGDFATLCEVLYRFGYLAGEAFAAVQGGPFASLTIARRIEWLRERGFLGCGQSSWGPTVYVLTRCQSHATELTDLVRSETAEVELTVASPQNHGAAINPVLNY